MWRNHFSCFTKTRVKQKIVPPKKSQLPGNLDKKKCPITQPGNYPQEIPRHPYGAAAMHWGFAFRSSFEMAWLARALLLRTHMAHSSGKEAGLIYGPYNYIHWLTWRLRGVPAGARWSSLRRKNEITDKAQRRA